VSQCGGCLESCDTKCIERNYYTATALSGFALVLYAIVKVLEEWIKDKVKDKVKDEEHSEEHSEEHTEESGLDIQWLLRAQCARNSHCTP
jgi:hypothetical protein